MGKICGKYGENMGKMMRNPNLMVIFAMGIHGDMDGEPKLFIDLLQNRHP